MSVKSKEKNYEGRKSRKKEVQKGLTCVIMLVCCLLCTFCNDTYERRFTKCLESVNVKEFTISESGKKGYSYENADPICLLGAPLPEFKTKDLDGNIISTQSIKGKINVLNFWFIKCKPCVAEIPNLNTLPIKYSKNEYNFLALTLDNTSLLRPFLKKQPFNFTIIPNAKKVINDKFHMIYGYPFTIITDKKNKIIGTLNADNPETTLTKIELIIDNID